MQNITVSNLLKMVESYKIFCGMTSKEISSKVVNHVVPMQFDPLLMEDDEHFRCKEYTRSINYVVLTDTAKFYSCKKADKSLESFAVRKNQQLTTPAKLKATISATNPHRVLLSLREQRLKAHNWKNKF